MKLGETPDGGGITPTVSSRGQRPPMGRITPGKNEEGERNWSSKSTKFITGAVVFLSRGNLVCAERHFAFPKLCHDLLISARSADFQGLMC